MLTNPGADDPRVLILMVGIVLYIAVFVWIRAITGLDGSLTLATPEHRSPAPPPPAGTSVGPCSHYWAELYSVGGHARSGRAPRSYLHAGPR